MKHPDYISTNDFAKALHVHPETIRRWRRTGRLVPALTTPGGQAMYSRAQVHEFYGDQDKNDSGPEKTATPVTDRTEGI